MFPKILYYSLYNTVGDYCTKVKKIWIHRAVLTDCEMEEKRDWIWSVILV